MSYFSELYKDLVCLAANSKMNEIRRTMGSMKASSSASVNRLDITPTQQMLSSCTGALVTSIIVTPLDVVKIRIQAQQKEFLSKKCFLYCNGLMEHVCYCNGTPPGTMAVPPSKWFKRPLPVHFNGTLDAFSKIIKAEGVASLWSGLPPTLVMAVPATVIYFTIYDQLRVLLCHKLSYAKDNQPPWVPMLAGGSARTISATIISPLELVRTKMQSAKLSYWELRTAISDSVRSQGVLSLWRGLGPTILRDVPFSALYWLNYEFLKQHYKQTDPTFGFSFAAGAVAGTVAAVITLPFDVVKTHRQIELGEKVMEEEVRRRRGSSKNTTSTASLLKRIYSQRGVAGLFSGIVPRVVKVAPACAIMISTYEFGKAFFRQHNAEKETSKT